MLIMENHSVKCYSGKHKMLSKLATQSFNILRLIAQNPIFLRPKLPYFNVARLSRLQMAQKWPKMTQNGPKWPKYDPKRAKMALEWPKMIQSGPKMTQNGPQLPQMAQKWRPDLRTFSKSFVSQSLSLSLERALSSEIGSQDPCSAHHAVVAWQHFMLLCHLNLGQTFYHFTSHYLWQTLHRWFPRCLYFCTLCHHCQGHFLNLVDKQDWF